MLEENEFLDILCENLTEESKCFLFTLFNEKRPLHKEELRDVSNRIFSELGKPVVSSQYSLDRHTARLEGAGLVKVQVIGRVRIYSITDLGTKLLKYVELLQKHDELLQKYGETK